MNEITHDPSVYIRGIQQILISDKKRIGFLFGAGSSLARKNARTLIVPAIGEMTKMIVKEISKIDIPTLSSILTVKFSQSEKLNYICDICNNWNGKNSRALSAHKRGCKIINTT